VAETFSEEVYGPELDCDIDEIEDLAVLAARAAFDAVIARALLLQNQKLPDQLACPKRENRCRVDFKRPAVRGRMGPAEIQEPVCHCSKCERGVFPQRETGQ
jgi:hypothetical protein